ncbi:MAG: hypothetical protein JWR77_814 [Rhizorhabdus sp.]|nr:hypothetical protein [Rhizorhabdus sp.]
MLMKIIHCRNVGPGMLRVWIPIFIGMTDENPGL